MENNALLQEEQALGSDQLLKLTALVYLKEALVNQQYENCRELIDTAKSVGVAQSDISAVIADYLKTGNLGRQKGNRLRSSKEE